MNVRGSPPNLCRNRKVHLLRLKSPKYTLCFYSTLLPYLPSSPSHREKTMPQSRTTLRLKDRNKTPPETKLYCFPLLPCLEKRIENPNPRLIPSSQSPYHPSALYATIPTAAATSSPLTTHLQTSIPIPLRLPAPLVNFTPSVGELTTPVPTALLLPLGHGNVVVLLLICAGRVELQYVPLTPAAPVTTG